MRAFQSKFRLFENIFVFKLLKRNRLFKEIALSHCKTAFKEELSLFFGFDTFKYDILVCSANHFAHLFYIITFIL